MSRSVLFTTLSGCVAKGTDAARRTTKLHGDFLRPLSAPFRRATASTSMSIMQSQKGATPRKDPLRLYHSKRNFAATPEPEHDGDTRHPTSSFVVQKHWASSLHYDFRLELDGTLKSWAVPKGPSLDPTVKRMAVQVEDHPIAYGDFEGTIPAKQYGAGKVIVWDAGYWTSTGDALDAFRAGNLKFELHGHKLRGKWVLVRIKGKGEKQVPWLLIKEKDGFVRSAADFSVIDEQPDSVLALGLPEKPAAQTATRSEPANGGMPPEAVMAALPASLSPQLATLSEGPPPDAENWVHEIKFDGYRMLARIDGSKVHLFSRNGLDWSSKLLSLRRALARMKLPAGWYDGEIVLPNADGIPDFGALQNCFDSAATDDVVYYLFDLPYAGGHDLRGAPLHARRALLRRLLSQHPSEKVRLSEVFVASGRSVLSSACKLGLEGVIAKRRDSIYRSSRSADWIKLKCGQRQEFVIGGYTDPHGARTGFGALLLGVHDTEGALQYAGNVGSGFRESALTDIQQRLKQIARKTSPFAAMARIEGRPHWVEPRLIAEVSFGEWTRAGRVRHGVFRGLRSDKAATSIVREKTQRLNGEPPVAHSPPAVPGFLKNMRVTHPDRVVDASTGATKVDLLRYYALIGKVMMKHLKDRPVSLVRAPEGVDGNLFFQKHADTDKMPGMRQWDPARRLDRPPLIEVTDARGLLSAAQWNVIEFHSMNTRTESLEHPDRLIFDLDPGTGVSWVQVQEAALLARSLLNTLGLPAFLKTSGGKGLHIVVPIRAEHDWDTAKGFSQAVVQHMAKTIPQRFVAKSGPKNRVGRIYIDYLRNGLGATTVSAWSARARPGLGISVPVGWDELDALRGGDHWRVATVQQRLDKGNAPWDSYARAARSLGAAMRALGYKPRK